MKFQNVIKKASFSMKRMILYNWNLQYIADFAQTFLLLIMNKNLTFIVL